jgi:trehalose 6-phosphate phosphatase
VKNILLPQNLRVLRAFVSSDVLIALDFDGTLAPIVKSRGQARMRASTRLALLKLTDRFPCAVISGRAFMDIQGKVSGIPLVEVVGNHGLEWGRPTPTMRRVLTRVGVWRRTLSRELSSIAGTELEDKRFTLSVHYRNSAHPASARKKISRLLEDLPGARIQGGKRVFNVLPVNLGDKGTALERIMARSGCVRAVFVGDDVTDEDVFALGNPERILTIRVGKRRDSRADYFVRDQEAVDLLLAELLKARMPLAAPGPRDSLAA